ncbi:hypothetical protein [Aeromonas sp.]|uniref:hypothetical protein n=1 Tax=Aeromonas sp. TaxID=647 RepID=UPI00258C1C26|nr:hypothetical protein [Aeromonas sp.]MCX7127509.1 hypothetical protein [Aeromonas sp.]
MPAQPTSYKVSTLEQLAHIVDQLSQGIAIEVDQIDWSGLEQLKFTLEGDPTKFNGTLTSGMCKGLYDLQMEFYKIFTLVKYQTDNLQRLKNSEKEQLELVFTVDEGCTEIIGELKDFIKTIGEAFSSMTTGMSGAQKTGCYILTVFALTGGVVGWHLADLDAEKHKTDSAAKQTAAQSDAENERMRILKDGLITIARGDVLSQPAQVTKEVEELTTGVVTHSAKAHEHVLKSALDADSVTINGIGEVKLGNKEINSYVQSPTEPLKAFEKTLKVEIDSIKRNGDRILISCHLESDDDSSFTAVADTSFLDPSEIHTLFDAFRDGQPIEVHGSFKSRGGVIESGQLSSVTGG